MIVLIGFMGAGKSSALDALTADGLATADTDHLIEARIGMPIAEIFDTRGEPAFREIEREIVIEALADPELDAVALGGGAVLFEPVREALKAHTVVLLEVEPEIAWARVSGGDRPLATDRESFRRLLEQRRPVYESVADAILPGAGREVWRAASRPVRALVEAPVGTRMLWARSGRHGGPGGYPVYVGPGLLGAGALRSGPAGLDGEPYLFSDETVAPLHAEGLGPVAASVAVAPGESAKTLGGAEQAMRELAVAGMTRGDHLLALGGGVVGDLAGFCAHTFQRGVPVVQLPTTLVAQVDSAYGGKTGVDIPEGKNYIGAFHMPSAVIADTSTLRTLPEAELTAGMAELIKTALLSGGRLWEQVRALEPGGILQRPDLIFESARYKCEIVAADERDEGIRAVLNLGHTIGHAIEAATGYGRYRHGEAVALGLLASLRLSEAGPLREEVGELLRRHGLPVALDPEVGADAVIEATRFDKKRTADGIGFVLLPEPGGPSFGESVDAGRVRDSVEELRRAAG